jgi:hypothetical protein
MTDGDTANISEWVMILREIFLLLSGASSSVVGRVMATTGLVFWVLCFNVAMPYWGNVVNDGGQPMGVQLLLGFTASVLFERIAWAECCFWGVTDQVVGFYEAYAGFLLLFIDPEINSNGFGFMGQ